jgi:hypothetical protein
MTMNRQPDRHRQTDRQTQTDGQTDKKTDRHGDPNWGTFCNFICEQARNARYAKIDSS